MLKTGRCWVFCSASSFPLTATFYVFPAADARWRDPTRPGKACTDRIKQMIEGLFGIEQICREQI